MLPRLMSLLLLLALSGCTSAPHKEGGWFALRWMEWPNMQAGPSTKATEADRTRFEVVDSYDYNTDKALFEQKVADLREGDLIAYRMGLVESTLRLLTGDIAKASYGMFKYGHLAIVVADPADGSQLRLFSSESFKGANLDEGLDSLKSHRFDVYRLDQWDRVDIERFHEFVRMARHKAGHWFGYDFTGMFGMWNSNLRPSNTEEIGREYICSTVVVAALYYSGIELDAIQRGGIIDVVTPLQVVASRGRVIRPPQGEWAVESGEPSVELQD